MSSQANSNSFISWKGGKSRLTKRIIPLLAHHHCYCEVFAGAAWLLFRKEESRVEIINDINSELVTLYRVVQNHLKEFTQNMRWLLVARDEFDSFVAQDPATLTDIQRAVRFFFLIRTTYGSRIKNPVFGISTSNSNKFTAFRFEEELSAAHRRLSRVYIENRPFQYVITRFDKPDTLFYLDPPYYGCENDYGNGMFSREDFTVLRDLLASIKGKFVMSINDVPEIRELFKDFVIREVPTKYSTAQLAATPVTELLIFNYAPPTVQEFVLC